MGILQGWRHCPRCSVDLGGDEHRVECPECGFVAYANPVPTATAVCVDEQGRVLLGRRALEPDKGLWDLPGGFVDEGEHPLDALRRELREETGLEIEPREFLGVWMDRYGYDSAATSTLNLYWTARVLGGEEEAADDVAELRWFPPEEFPRPDELAFEVNAKVLSAWLESSRNEHA
jgi:ADP-ribose pyrophosphatase YjhB (NUDIX family)